MNKKLVCVILLLIFVASILSSISLTSASVKGAVSITFDDGNLSQYTNAFPLLKQYGFAATFYVPIYFNGAPCAISPAQLREMQTAGMEIGSHGYSHIDLTQCSDDVLLYEISESKAVLNSWNITARNFAAPYGTGDLSRVATVASNYYRSMRTTYWSANSLPCSLFTLNALNAEWGPASNPDVLDSLKTMVDRTIANNQWTIFYFHYGDDSYFASFLAYLKSSGVQVLTVNQALNIGLTPTPTPIPTATPTASPTATPKPTATPTPTASPSPSPSPTPLPDTITISIIIEPLGQRQTFTQKAGEPFHAPDVIALFQRTWVFSQWSDGYTETTRIFNANGTWSIIYV